MAQAAPTRGAREAEGSWAGRPVVATTLRGLVVVLPIVASFLATRLLASTLWRPAGTSGIAVWLAQVVVVGSTVVLLTGRASKRLLPLAALYSLTVAFPDQAPSRFRVALRSGNVRAMQQQFDDVRANGFADDRTAAMTQILELVAALSRHEPRTRGHTDRVRAYTDVIAEEMGLGDAEREKLRWAAMMHDVGKLAVPASVLNKPGRPTDDEWRTLMTHPTVGGELVEPLADWLGEWRHAASQHHERWDGTGYPHKLAGDRISLAGRIVAVADAYDVITSARSYKKPMPAEAARRELVRCAGSQFDPTIVRAFLSASIGGTGSRAGAIGWLLEVVRTAVTATAQGATTAGAVVAAGSIAMASVVVTPPPAELSDASVSAARDAAHGDAGVVVPTTVHAVATRTAASVSAGTATVGSGATGASGALGASGTGTTGPGTMATVTLAGTRPTPTTTIAPASTPGGAAASTTTTAGAPTSPASTTTSPGAPPPTTAAPGGSACQALNAGATNLAGADLSGCAFSPPNHRLVGVDLSGANLTGASIQGMSFEGGTLLGANLAGAVLSGSTITGVDLRSTVWTGAALTGTTFDANDLRDAVFRDASITGSKWTTNDLSRVDFTGAKGKPPTSTGNTWSSTVCANGATTSSTACF